MKKRTVIKMEVFFENKLSTAGLIKSNTYKGYGEGLGFAAIYPLFQKNLLIIYQMFLANYLLLSPSKISRRNNRIKSGEGLKTKYPLNISTVYETFRRHLAL